MIRQLLCIGTLLLLSGSTQAVTRFDIMLALGDSSIAIEWTPDSLNTRNAWYQQYGSGCNGADSVYRHCDFTAGQTYRSIAYSYGGEDGYVRFREKLESGFLAGSHMCHYNVFGDPSKTIAGTDCSGFICYLWGVPRVSTRELYSQYKVITREDIAPGDILVKSGSHAVIVIEREDATHFIIWESTSVGNCCRERSIDITDSYWDTYYPRRYEGLMMSVKSPLVARPTNGLPTLRSTKGTILMSTSHGWSGSIELYTPSGRCLYSAEHALTSNSAKRIPVPVASGMVIARFLASGAVQGAVQVIAVE